MVKQRLSGLQFFLLIFDIVIVNFAYIIALTVREVYNVTENFSVYNQAMPWITIISIFMFVVFDLYSGFENESIISIIYSIGLSVSLSTMFIIGAIYLSQVSALPRLATILAAFIQIVLMTMLRIIVLAIYKHLQLGKRVLLIGNNENEMMMIADKFIEYDHGSFKICDFLNSSNIEELEAKVENNDIIVINDKVENKEQIINYCVIKQKEILMVPDMFGIVLYSSEMQFVDDTLMLSMKPIGLKTYQELTKRIFDVSVSFIMLVALSPIMLLAFCLVHVTSQGPALYRQERLGLDGTPFEVLKFRTMINNAEEEIGPVLATENDPRITKLGIFLRATRIDELPQLFNVFMGQMSLVGPRPERDFFVNQFSETVPFYQYRMVVRPGITGLAQVAGRYTTTAEDKLRFDLMYIRNYSLFLDLKILFQTVRVVLERDKAAGLVQDVVFDKSKGHFEL